MPGAFARLLLTAAAGLLFEANTAAALRWSSRTTPVAKVIDLLKKLSLQVQEEGKGEAAQYDKYACFCKEQADQKAYAIAKSNDQMKSLSTEIELLTAEIGDLDKEVGDLGTAIEKLDGEIQELTDTRSEELEKYEIADKNVTGAISACEEAIKLMKASRDKVKETGLAQLAGLTNRTDVVAMLAVVAGDSKLSDGARRAVRALQPGTAKSYEYHSKDVIEILQNLLAQFKETKQTLYEAEFEKRSIAEKQILGKNNDKKFKEEDKAEKTELSDSKSAEKHDLEAQLDEETKARDADTEFQTVLTTQCSERAAEWDQRSKARAGELSVINEAVGLLESGAAAQYSANKKLVGLPQAASAVRQQTTAVAPKAAPKAVPKAVPQAVPKAAARPALLQMPPPKGTPVATLQQAPRTPEAAVQMVAKNLNAAAGLLGSTALAEIAVKAAVMDDPVDHFVKVRGIIKDLITRLEEEADAEANQKSLCDDQVGAAVKSRDEQQSEVEAQGATIAKNEALIATRTKEIEVLAEEIAALNKALNDATKLRKEESDANAKTIEDAEEGKAALDGAIKVLEEYYKAQGSLLQTKKRYVPPNSDRDGNTVDDMAPEMSYSGKYEGKTDSAGGIIGLLQTIQADFQRTVDTVTSAEEEAKTKLDEFKTQSGVDIKAKDDDKKGKEDEIVTAEEAVVTAKDDKIDAEKLHESAIEELEKLSAMCVDGAESYEERAKKREQEIEALKEAMDILENFNK